MNKFFSVLDFYTIANELFLIFSIGVLLSYGIYVSSSKNYNYPVLTKNISWLSIFVIVFLFFILNNSLQLANLALNNFLIFDNITTIVKIITILAGISCLLISIFYLKQEKLNIFEYKILFLLSILAIFLVISSYDFLSIYLALELQNLTFYIIASIKRNSEYSTEAGLKYFILGAVSSGLLLLGIAIIYGFTGLTNFEDLNRFFSSTMINLKFDEISNSVLLGITLIIVSFFFKLSAAPFHIWSPDVYEGSSTSVISFFNIITKIVIFTLFLRLFEIGFHDLFNYKIKIIIFCSLISLTIGSFSALFQKRFKRFLAYSSISHIGFIIITLAAANTNGLNNLFIYIIIYIIIIIGIFSILISLRKFKSYRINYQIRYLTEINILSLINPLAAFSFAIILFSIAGIPPLAGFFSKLFVFTACLQSSLYFLTFIGILLSGITAFYYIQIIKIIYFGRLNFWSIYIPIDKSNAVMISITTLLLILFFADNSIFITSNLVSLNIFHFLK
nr:NADH dehydrogenase subunit 2 [Cyanidium caldarium]QNR39831.1 NADH dehydrogenase subunit 2 [Cyanidium caldarium]